MDINDEELPKELTSPVLRRGKWTVEEERYTEQIIDDFDQGVLNVPEGTTLRTYLSRVLNCDPMRITKKYTGNVCIGKRTYLPKAMIYESDYQYLGMCYSRLEDLRRAWISKLLLTEQWNNRKITAFRGGNSVMKPEVFVGQVPVGLNPISPFTYSTLATTTNSITAVGSFEHTISPCGEENNETGVLQEILFNELKVLCSLRPFVRDAFEIELIIDWLKFCSAELKSNSLTDSQVLDKCASGCKLTLSSVYKVLLSGCVTDLKLLHSCVQAVFERLIVGSDAHTTSSMVPSFGLTVSVSSDKLDQPATAVSVTPTLGTPTHSASSADGLDQLTNNTTTDSIATTCDSVVSPDKNSSNSNKPLTLHDCLRSLQNKRSFSMMQGPITATAAVYKEHQHRALSYTSSTTTLNTTHSINNSIPSFLSCVDPQVLSNRISSSLNQSMLNISKKVLEQHHILNLASPSNIETAAEALLGLIQQ